MAQIRLNALVDRVRGSIDGLVIKRYGNGTIITRKPTHENTEWSPRQIGHRGRFKTAIEYGRYAMADPELYAAYGAVGRKHILARAVDRPGGIGEMAIEMVVKSPPAPDPSQGKPPGRGRRSRFQQRPALPSMKLIFPDDPECVFQRRRAPWKGDVGRRDE